VKINHSYFGIELFFSFGLDLDMRLIIEFFVEYGFFLAFWWNLQKLAIKMQFFVVIDVFAEFYLAFCRDKKKLNLIKTLEFDYF
jgi:hypothetical protein